MVGFDTEHHPVGLHEVVDRRAFFQELRIGAHVEGQRSVLVHGGRNLCRRADRHRGLGDDHELALHVLADLFGDGEHMPEIRGAVLIGRRAHRDENDVGRCDGLSDIRCEGQSPLLLIALDIVVQARLIDRQDVVP